MCQAAVKCCRKGAWFQSIGQSYLSLGTSGALVLLSSMHALWDRRADFHPYLFLATSCIDTFVVDS